MKIKSTIVLLLIAAAAYGQPASSTSLFNKGKINGIIIDAAEGNPLPAANVTIHNQNDSSFAGGISTDNSGEFQLENLTQGKYYLRISYVGYSNKYVPNIEVSENRSYYNLGKIKLNKSTVLMQETEVVGERAAEELHLDKKVINVSKDLTSSGGTALDVLQNQPSIRVDPDGTVYLRGSSDFKVMVNGKPSVLQGADALKQISANMIETIEIITNPSSKYDAEGSAGIININLKKQTEYSLSGIANLNSGTRDKYNGDFSINYNVDGMNITGGIDYRDNANFNNQAVERVSFVPSGIANNLMTLAIRDKRQQYTGRGSIDYTIDEKNSASISVSGGNIDILTSINTNVLNDNYEGLVYALSENNFETPVKYFNTSFNYSYKFQPKVNYLSFEATYSNVYLPSVRTTNEYNSDETFSTKSSIPINTVFINNTGRNEGRTKLDYTHNFGEESKLETGIQSNFSYRKFDIENKHYDWISSIFINDNTLTNNFNFRNNVYAAYISYTNVISDFNFMLGLRAEYMDRMLEQQTLGNKYNYKKLDYFPSFNLSRKVDGHQFQISYSRRVNRPNENLLNPFPFYSDTYLTTAGNPYLMPEYINSYELNYQKMFGDIFFSVQTYYRNSSNTVSQTFSVDSTGKLFGTFNNIAVDNTYGSEISSSFSLVKIIRLDPAVNLYGSSLKGNLADLNVNKNNFNWNVRLNTTFTLSQDTKLQVSGNYFGRIDQAQFEIKPFLMLSASIKQEFLNKKLSVTLQARNLLKSGDLEIVNNGTNFNSTIFVHREVPVLQLMLSYNFNNFKRTAKANDNIDIQSGI
jgi:outer membrane receptor protein involved in Fe transport